MKGITRREWAVTLLAFFTWGVTMLCRTSFGYYLDALELSAAQAGLANAVTSGVVCASAIVVSRLAEKRNALGQTLAAALAVCAASVWLLAGAKIFAAVLAARARLGLGCGPVFTLNMSLVERQTAAERYPVVSGIVADGEAVLNTILGPVLIVFLLGAVGFGGTNAVLGIALLALSAMWLWRCKGDGGAAQAAPRGGAGGLAVILRSRNAWLCVVGGIFTLLACWCIYMYAPTLLTKEGGFTDRQMSLVMTSMGVFMMIGMTVVPLFSDRIGRCAAVAIFSLAGLAAMAGLWLAPGAPVSIALFILFGGCCSVISMFYMAIIPVESLPEGARTLALAVINASGELFGAAIGPYLAGLWADASGVRCGMLAAALSMAVAAAAGTLLKETGPARHS